MNAFFGQYPFLLPIVVWVIVHVVKVILRLHDATFDRRYLWSSGGMPSGHSAVMTSVVVLVAVREGIASSLFVAVCVIAAIVIYDATHVRREAGKHASILNQLLRKDPALQREFGPLNPHLGHTPWQVFIGALIGAVITLFLSW